MCSNHLMETSLTCMLPFIPLFFWLHFKSWNCVPQRFQRTVRQKLSFDRNPLLYPADQGVGVIAVGRGKIYVQRTYEICWRRRRQTTKLQKASSYVARQSFLGPCTALTSEHLASFLSSNDAFGTGRRRQASAEQRERKVKYSASQTLHHSLPPSFCSARLENLVSKFGSKLWKPFSIFCFVFLP